MTEQKKHLFRPVYLLYAILLLLSLAAALKTILISADIDESYAITLAFRLVQGDAPFVEMWEIHQTSAIFCAPFVALFYKITGSLTGVLIYLRIIGTLLALLVSTAMFRTLSRYVPRHFAFVLAILLFNYSPKYIQTPEFSLVAYWGITLLGLCLLMFFQIKKDRYLILGGICLAACVLCYPGAVILYPVCLVLLFLMNKVTPSGQHMGRICLIFTAGPALSAVLFLGYLALCSDLTALPAAIPHILSDASHEQNYYMVFYQLVKDSYHILLPCLAAIVVSEVASLVWYLTTKRKIALVRFLLPLALCISGLWQFHTLTKVNFLIIIPILIQIYFAGCYFLVRFPQKQPLKLIFLALVLPSGFLLLSISMLSNLPLTHNGGALLPGTLASLCILRAVCSEYHGDWSMKKQRAARLAILLLLVYFVGTIFTARLFLVRFTGTQRKNIFYGYSKATEGPLAGIWLSYDDLGQYTAKLASTEAHVTPADTFLYIGCDMFQYQAANCKIGTGNTISTPGFDKQILDYYELHPDRIPSVVFLDREYGAGYEFVLTEEPFASWFAEYYDVEHMVMEGPINIYYRR